MQRIRERWRETEKHGESEMERFKESRERIRERREND